MMFLDKLILHKMSVIESFTLLQQKNKNKLRGIFWGLI